MSDALATAQRRVLTAQQELADALSDLNSVQANAEDRLAMWNEDLVAGS